MTWYVLVKEICPYYFYLQDIFLECAGIKPAATTDEIFHGSDAEIELNTVQDNEEIEEDTNSDNLDKGDSDEIEKGQNASVSAGCKKRASKSKGSVGKCKSKIPKKNKTAVKENDGFSALPMSIARRKDAEMRLLVNTTPHWFKRLITWFTSWRVVRLHVRRYGVQSKRHMLVLILNNFWIGRKCNNYVSIDVKWSLH